MKGYFLVLLVVLAPIAYGQVLSTAPVWNIGVHINPAFTTALRGSDSHYDAQLRPVYIAPGINTGVNLQYRLPEMTFEASINVVSKAFVIRQRLRHFANVSGFDQTRNNHLKAVSYSTSLEVPFIASYCLHHHDRKMVYDVHALAGCSAELNSVTGFSVITSGNTGSIVRQEYTLPEAGTKHIWVNAIAGFKIQAILRIIGLIDYGVAWHIPIQKSGPYYITTEVKDYDSGNTKVLDGEYHPHLGYLDFRLCYYFLNIDNNRQRIRYRIKKEVQQSAPGTYQQ